MGYLDEMKKKLPKAEHKRMYTLMSKEDKIEIIKQAYNLTHGKGKRKRKKGRKK